MAWKILLVLGILGIILGFVVTAVSTALPMITDGRTSWEEAMLGIIPGIVLIVIAFLFAAVGLIFVIKGRNSK